MNYLVMEVHPAYAVVLDEEGRFLKAANLCYQVGDTIPNIVELQKPKARSASVWKPLSGLASAAACLCLVFFGWYQPNYTAYGTLRIQINPDVEMSVSRTDRVLDLEGLNGDGEDLIEGYSYKGKDRETAANELVDRAIEMGYLSNGETVSITVNSTDADWQAREEAQVKAQLEERYGETIVIQLGSEADPAVTPPLADPPEVVIPVTPSSSAGGDFSYADTDYGPNADGVTDFTDTDYGPNADGVTDFTDTDYGPNADGVTDYTDTDYGLNADGVTDYADPDYGPYTDGVTDYEERSDGSREDDEDGNDTDYDDDSGDSDDDDWDDADRDNWDDDDHDD